ncbi:hypothetical protein TYRP_015237 [Tyrophagus putrescentiae]|nr:hypothetical protein TYRP_015237 [Tyrophagus putrescentiae]
MTSSTSTTTASSSSIFNSCPSDPTTVFISASVAQIDAQRRAFEQRLHQACTDYVRTLFDFTLGSELAAADYPEGCHRKMQLYMDKGTAAIKAALDEVAIYLLMLDRRNLPPKMLQQQQLLEEKENFFNDNNSVGCNGSVLQQQQSLSVSSFNQPPQPAFSASNGHSSEFFSTPSQHSFTSFTSPSSITVSPESTVSTATAAAVLTPTKELLGELQFRMTMQSPESVQPLSLAGDGSGSGSSALYSCPLSIGCRPIVSRTKLRKHLLHDHAINNCDVAGLLRKAVRLGGSNGVVNGSGGGGGSSGGGGANASNLMMIKSAKCAAGARAFSRGLTPRSSTFSLAPKLSSPESCRFASLPPISFDTDLRR